MPSALLGIGALFVGVGGAVTTLGASLLVGAAGVAGILAGTYFLARQIRTVAEVC